MGIEKARKIYIDELRFLATLFVICGHTVSLAQSLTAPVSTAHTVLGAVFFLFPSCNLLFVMISGALLLPVRGESVGTFFARRFARVAVPMLVYYLLYVCAKFGIRCLLPQNWLFLFQRLLVGAPEEAPHFWLVYVILGLYVLTPFLRWIVANIPDSVLFGLILVVFFVNALDTYLPLFHLDAHLSVIVDSYVGVFLLGYFLSAPGKEYAGSRKTEHVFLACGLLSYVLSVALMLTVDGCEGYLYDNAPTMLFLASAIFLCVKRAAAGRSRTPCPVRLIGKYSYSVLLIHWGVLHYVVKQLLGVNVLGGGIVGGCLLAALLTLVISLAAAIVIDHTLVWAVLAVLRIPYVFYHRRNR